METAIDFKKQWKGEGFLLHVRNSFVPIEPISNTENKSRRNFFFVCSRTGQSSCVRDNMKTLWIRSERLGKKIAFSNSVRHRWPTKMGKKAPDEPPLSMRCGNYGHFVRVQNWTKKNTTRGSTGSVFPQIESISKEKSPRARNPGKSKKRQATKRGKNEKKKV